MTYVLVHRYSGDAPQGAEPAAAGAGAFMRALSRRAGAGASARRRSIPRSRAYFAVRPPSSTSSAPVISDESSEARNTTARATSSARPRRPMGWKSLSHCSAPS